MRAKLLLAVLPLLLVGGWATATVEDLPEYFVARHPTALTFTVRQHGLRPLSGLQPSLEAVGRGSTVTAPATPGREAGKYTATLTLPDTGEWTITIHTGFMNNHTTLLPIRAIVSGSTPPAAVSDAERGRHLFVAKGCVMCHVYRGLSDRSIAVGPELTELRLEPAFLTRFLADPPSVIPPKDGSGMPNLGLKTPEITALIAFLNRPQP